MTLDAKHPSALVAAEDRILYAAAEPGLLRIDIAARTAALVKSAEQLTGFESLSWRNGALVGVERVAQSFLIVRVPLDAAGVRAQPRQFWRRHRRAPSERWPATPTTTWPARASSAG